MKSLAYYNEIDPFAAEWLRELIIAGLIAPGIVDTRSIEDVRPRDLEGFMQCHFFAGIGVWSYALRLAGWPDDRPVWTASCPCQPFSASGRRNGFADERHLWPHLHWLIDQRDPAIVFGEQVASKAAEPWIDLVQADLEALDYAFGCIPFPSAGVGAPHIRDRAYLVGHSLLGRTRPNPGNRGCEESSVSAIYGRPQGDGVSARHDGAPGRLADASGQGRQEQRGQPAQRQPARESRLAEDGAVGRLANTNGDGRHAWSETAKAAGYGNSIRATRGDDRNGSAGPTNGFWRNADWLLCRDGKWRPVEPAFKQMVDGLACAMVYLRDASKEDEKIEDVKNAAAEDSYSGEILRAVRGGTAPEAVWLEIGGQIGFYEATLLFAFLLEHEGKLGRFIDCATQGGPEACKKVLREMWKNGIPTCAPRGRKYPQRSPGNLQTLCPSCHKLAHLKWFAA